jgi:hypothetical protein
MIDDAEGEHSTCREGTLATKAPSPAVFSVQRNSGTRHLERRHLLIAKRQVVLEYLHGASICG